MSAQVKQMLPNLKVSEAPGSKLGNYNPAGLSSFTYTYSESEILYSFPGGVEAAERRMPLSDS